MRRARIRQVPALLEADPAQRLPVVRWARPGGRLVGLLGAAILAPTVVVAVGVAVAAMSWPGVAAATPVSGWSIQSTPNPAGSNSNLLSGVSCTSISQCTSVGGAVNSAGIFVTLAQRWQGSSWTLQSTPNPTGSTFDLLSGVSCTSRTACTAVGEDDDVTLAELWDGSSWTIQSTPNPRALLSGLSGVSCTSASACTAVGAWGTTNTFTPVLTLAERWNGSSWTIQRTPKPPGGVLEGVSCTSAKVCTATGHSYRSLNNPTVVTLAERRNGTTWSIQPTPNPSGATNSDLSSVSCTAANACTAVGSFSDSAGTETLAERWNGRSWSIQPVPIPAGATSSSLSGVSCTAPSGCTAVGSYVDSAGSTVTLAESWDGTSWSIQPTPNPSGATSSSLSGVSCTALSACTAVGSYVDSSGNAETLAERSF